MFGLQGYQHLTRFTSAFGSHAARRSQNQQELATKSPALRAGFTKGRRDTMNMQNTTGTTKDLEGPYADTAKNAARRRSFACNPGKIGGRERFRSTVRAALFQDLSHRLPDTSQSAGCGRCGSTMFSARLHESETISRRLNFFDMGNSDRDQ